jgi:acyl-CoA thioesterase I
MQRIGHKFIYGCCFFALLTSAGITMQKPKRITYLPLGDSYTICTGAKSEESWPVLLTQHLNEHKISCSLIENPARNGFTSQDLINLELPLCKKLKPHFVSLLIGVNDWVQGVPKDVFHKNLRYILNEVQANIAKDGKIVLITIPDFGVTPQGKQYANGRNISNGIAAFNDLLKQEAKTRKLVLIDIFELSKKMGLDESLVAKDGLHPSAKEYAAWEKLMLPEVLKLWP